jgi:hypothetical protein
MTLSRTAFSKMMVSKKNDTQNNDTQHNETHHNAIMTLQNGIQQNYAQQSKWHSK